LDVLHLAGFRLFNYSGDFVWGHRQASRGEAIAEVFDRFSMPFTFVRHAEQAIRVEVSNLDFFDMLDMMIKVNGVDQDVIEIDDNTDVDHVCEDIVNKVLESGRRIH
jgi:hypothetical protein